MTRFLFAGDSVTDCGRTFFAPDVAAGELGSGWVRIVAGELGRLEPEAHEVLNAGVSGDRVASLLDRWDRDVVRFQPDVLTILIGVNDSLLEPPTPLDELEDGFARLLASVPDVDTLVVAEPFVVVVDDTSAELRHRLLGHLAVMRRLIDQVDSALHLPLDDLMQEACGQAAPAWWAPDGIHPSVAGHALIAEAWLRLTGFHRVPE